MLTEEVSPYVTLNNLLKFLYIHDDDSLSVSTFLDLPSRKVKAEVYDGSQNSARKYLINIY